MISVRKYTVPKDNISANVSTIRNVVNNTSVVEEYDDSELRELIQQLQNYLDAQRNKINI